MSPNMFDQDPCPAAGRLDIGAWLQSGVRLPESLTQDIPSATNPVHIWFGGTLTFQPDGADYGPDSSFNAELDSTTYAGPVSLETVTETQSQDEEKVATAEEPVMSAPSYLVHFWEGLILSVQEDAVYVGLDSPFTPVEGVAGEVVESVVDDVSVSDDTGSEISADYAMAGSSDDIYAVISDVESPLSTNFDLVRWAPSFETLLG